jgi:hypothetical protein
VVRTEIVISMIHSPIAWILSVTMALCVFVYVCMCDVMWCGMVEEAGKEYKKILRSAKGKEVHLS